MFEIIPAILTDREPVVRKYLRQAEGVVDRVHIDIIDGIYADNVTIEPLVVEAIDVGVLLDYHLMVEEPIRWVDQCVEGQADRIIGHVEKMGSQKEFARLVKRRGLGVGLAIDLPTWVSEIDVEVLPDLDVILVMSINAGFGGQEFEDKALDKIHELASMRAKDDFSYLIGDDGGIVFDIIDDARREGADEVNIGNRIFEGVLEENIQQYKEAAYV